MVNASALPMIGAACCNSGMLTGPELGAALERAMRAMDVTQSAVAQEFGIKQPSVSEWIQRHERRGFDFGHLIFHS